MSPRSEQLLAKATKGCRSRLAKRKSLLHPPVSPRSELAKATKECRSKSALKFYSCILQYYLDLNEASVKTRSDVFFVLKVAREMIQFFCEFSACTQTQNFFSCVRLLATCLQLQVQIQVDKPQTIESNLDCPKIQIRNESSSSR